MRTASRCVYGYSQRRKGGTGRYLYWMRIYIYIATVRVLSANIALLNGFVET